MDETPQDKPDVPAWWVYALAACEPLRGRRGCFVAPEVPPKVFHGALRSYLRLEPGELPLAIVDLSRGALPRSGLALTTRGLRWSGRAGADDRSTTPGRDDPSRALTDEAHRWGRRLGYESVPDGLAARGRQPARLDLGGGRTIPLPGLDDPTCGALILALSHLAHAARTGDLDDVETPEAVDRARAAVVAVGRRLAELRRDARELDQFHNQAQAATPHVLASRAILGACVIVFLAMVASGVSPVLPQTRQLIAWGAASGVLVALGGQWWRLLTTTFLHGNLLHLAVNMFCLWQIGPLVERLYGNVGFTCLYLAAGLGGAMASVWWHPLVIGVGASGAIFGLFGGLLAFLLTHRATIPGSVLRPMRSGVLTFVVYNVLFGLAIPGIDNAAHLGGLATGFVAGLALRRPWPTPRPTSGLVRQLVSALALAAGLYLLGRGVEARIRANPQVAPLVREMEPPSAVAEFQALWRVLDPVLPRVETRRLFVYALLQQMEATQTVDLRAGAALDNLVSEAESDLATLRGQRLADPDLRALLSSLVASRTDFLAAARRLRLFYDTAGAASTLGFRLSLNAPPALDVLYGPDGVARLLDRSDREAREFIALRDAFLAKHGLALVAQPAAP